ncbi:hypothetical protein [Calidifontibacillus erzurumensis]|uniref:C-type cytochrome biogenesis protein CcmI n=1 Tax=Calidifontibacillus erzurumensis TaxID=2741433 RepID=A0A8J8KD20_9BACI|nr:hypothetical protein [Calidifontibacillus erzurumensis]NSL50230.1 hypothetical protein [Calidifontibacillus erzurumensis]
MVDIPAIIASFLLFIFCLYLVLSPFMEKSEMTSLENSKANDLDEISQEELYAVLNELEMDYKMNKLSEDDYKGMKRLYEEKIVELLDKEKYIDKA